MLKTGPSLQTHKLPSTVSSTQHRQAPTPQAIRFSSETSHSMLLRIAYAAIAFIIGIGQALAVLPGLSRSGTTIATGLLLGNKKESMAQFSFLMVIPPILGEALLDIVKALRGDEAFAGIDTLPLVVGFVAAFVSGCVACKWMINIVKKGKLVYFGIYCALAGLLVLILG